MEKLKEIWERTGFVGKIFWICVFINILLVAHNLYTGKL